MQKRTLTGGRGHLISDDTSEEKRKAIAEEFGQRIQWPNVPDSAILEESSDTRYLPLNGYRIRAVRDGGEKSAGPAPNIARGMDWRYCHPRAEYFQPSGEAKLNSIPRILTLSPPSFRVQPVTHPGHASSDGRRWG